MHRAVEHNGIVYVGGTTFDDENLDMAGQTQEMGGDTLIEIVVAAHK
jgi:hypothetical protein